MRMSVTVSSSRIYDSTVGVSKNRTGLTIVCAKPGEVYLF